MIQTKRISVSRPNNFGIDQFSPSSHFNSVSIPHNFIHSQKSFDVSVEMGSPIRGGKVKPSEWMANSKFVTEKRSNQKNHHALTQRKIHKNRFSAALQMGRKSLGANVVNNRYLKKIEKRFNHVNAKHRNIDLFAETKTEFNVRISFFIFN
jgi:hypothetical protein